MILLSSSVAQIRLSLSILLSIFFLVFVDLYLCSKFSIACNTSILDSFKLLRTFLETSIDKNIKLGSPPDGETNISPNEFKSNGKIVLDGSVSLEKIGKLNSKIILIIKQ